MDRIKVPADIDLEDRLAFGLTFRQLVILVVAAISGGDLVKAVLVAAAYFVIATGWTWFRFRQRASRAAPPERHPSSNGDRRP